VLLFAAIFLVGSAFSIAGRAARSLQFLRGTRVRVVAWGQPLPASDGPFYVESIASLGVGLLIRLHATPDARPILLKIAQPQDVLVSAERLTIGRAGYVQWSSRRLERPTGGPVPALIVEPVTRHPPAASGAPPA